MSRTTTRRTLSELIYEGWLYTVVGKGTYVASRRLGQELQPLIGFSDDLTRQNIQVASRVIALDVIAADNELALWLHLPPHTPLIRLKRVRLADDSPIAVQTAYLPEQRCPGLQRFDFTNRSLYDVLRREYGLAFQRGESVIRAGLATTEEQSLLFLPDPGAVLRTYQTTLLVGGGIVEYCESVFHGDRYSLTFDVASKEGNLTTFDDASPL